MKKITIFPLIVIALLLASCATPQVTVTSEVTVTLPPPTETPFPTLTPTPVAVNGIAEDAEGNKLAYLNGEWVVLPALDDDYKLVANADSVRALDENGVVKYALDMETGEWVVPERPIEEFPMCNFADFQQCQIPFEKVQEHGRYVQSTLTEDLFDPEKAKFVTEYEELSVDGKKLLVPDIDTVPNYPDPETRPFIRDYAAGMTEVDGTPHIEVQIPYYVPGLEPTEWPVMSGLQPLRADLKGNWPNVIETYINDMNIVAWRIDADSVALATKFVNPATGVNFTQAEVRGIIEEMRRGDFSRTNGLVLLFAILDSKSGWFD
jgi:hypothetical protein